MSWDKTFDHPPEIEAAGLGNGKPTPPTPADLRALFRSFEGCVYAKGDVVVARPEFVDDLPKYPMLVIGVKESYEDRERGLERMNPDLLVLVWSDGSDGEDAGYGGSPIYSHTVMRVQE